MASSLITSSTPEPLSDIDLRGDVGAPTQLDETVSGVGRDVLSGSSMSATSELSYVDKERNGHTGVASLITAKIGPTAVLTAETPQVTTVIEAKVQDLRKVEHEMVLVRVPQPDKKFDENNIEKYLSAGKAQMVFSTAAMQGQGVTRSIELTKKVKDEEAKGEEVEGEEVSDVERQRKVNVQFAKIKHVLGLGGREGFPNKAISYSVTWHFVEVYNEPGEPPVKYDLIDKVHIKNLLNDQSINGVDDEMVERVFADLLSINREIKTLTQHEVGKRKDCFLHDYEANPSGLELFRPFSKEDKKVKNDSRHGMYDKTMSDFGFLHKKAGRIFGKNQVNKAGAEALTKIEQAGHLKRSIYNMLSNEKAEIAEKKAQLTADETNMSLETEAAIKKIDGELAEIDRVMQEVGSSNDTVMNFTLMELTRAHAFGTGESLLAPCEDMDRRRLKLSETITEDYVNVLARENKGWFNRLYKPTQKDKQQAIEVGVLVHHLAAPNPRTTRRLEVLKATQRLNKKDQFSEVFKDPKGEKLILSAILRPPTGAALDVDLAGYSGASKVVKDVLKRAIDLHQEAVAAGGVKSYDAKNVYKAKAVGRGA